MNYLIVIIIISSVACVASIVSAVVACSIRKKNVTNANDKNSENAADISEKIQKNFRELGKEQQDAFVRLSSITNEQFRSSTQTLNDNLKNHSDEVNRNISNHIALVDQKFKDLLANEEKTVSGIETRLEKIANQIKESLAEIRSDNTTQLDKMREVVDEKLNKSLDEKLKNSFSIISEQLETFRKGLSEMENLSNGVNSLNKVLNGVKTRGTWGETSLQSLIEDVLAPEQYVRNANIIKSDVVEFCIKLPGGDNPVLLPVDSKFPLSDYERLVECSQNCDVEGMNAAKKELENRIKSEAKDINKYVNPPKTTDFAIMYLPIEGLYAEVTKNAELTELIRQKYKVIVAGPSTFAALLNSLQVGFRTLAIQKNSLEIQKVLVSFKTEFSRFASTLAQSEKQASKLSESLQEAIKRTNNIDKKLKGIDVAENAKALAEENGDNESDSD